MSLTFKLITLQNENFDKETIDNKLKGIIKYKECSEVLRKANLDSVSNGLSKLSAYIRAEREAVKQLQSIKPVRKELEIQSNKTWKIIPEFYDDETGITKYKSPKEFKVKANIRLEDQDNMSFVEVVNQAKRTALLPLLEFRKERKQIEMQEKTFYVDGLPEKVTYRVYVGGGFSGDPRPFTYKDPFRGTEHEYVTSYVNNNYFIHHEPNTFLNMQNAKKLVKIFERKKPLTNDKHVGVEIEFASKLNRIELARKLFKEGLQDYVCLVEDGSIRPVDEYVHTHELTIIAPEQLIHSVLNKALSVINENNASRVGRRCGLHVHLDMRNRNKEVVFHNLVKAQRILYAMNPRSRLDGTTADNGKDVVWSKKIMWDDFHSAWEELTNTDEEDRYYGINILSLNRHKTIEIRIHSGSTNFEKISSWVTILTSIANLEEMVDVEAFKPETFCKYYKLDNTILEYIKMRIAKFKDKNGNHITIDEAA